MADTLTCTSSKPERIDSGRHHSASRHTYTGIRKFNARGAFFSNYPWTVAEVRTGKSVIFSDGASQRRGQSHRGATVGATVKFNARDIFLATIDRPLLKCYQVQRTRRFLSNYRWTVAEVRAEENVICIGQTNDGGKNTGATVEARSM